MAYAALVSLSQTIDQILNHNQYFISHHEKHVRSIKEKVVFLQSFLDAFPERANILEGQMRDIANKAEDIIEYFILKQIHRRYGWTLGLSRVKFDHQLRKVEERIDSIARQAMEIKNSSKTKDNQVSDFSANSSSSRPAPTNKDAMIGFDDDLMEIKARLCGESSRLQVVPIFGMGGIGKTTLARNAYTDPLVMEHFQIRAWVTVSQDYSVQEILSGLLASINKLSTGRGGQDNEEKVYKSLKGQRYLIVMDDMWSTQAWDDVRNIFPDDANGSRLMLTTRLEDVAAHPNSCGPLHEMRLMDEDQSWNLLSHKVFMHQDCPPELENIGKKIARNCRGLPLVLVVIAGLLSTASKDPASWVEIAENVRSVVATNDGHIEKILSLSYNHLPHHLRHCLLYMGGFPEDHKICVSRLIKLWVAEGFLKHQNGSKTLEEEAEECVQDLARRSLVSVTHRKSDGKIKTCSLHDLMRDLCVRKAHEEKFPVNFRVGYGRGFSSIVGRKNIRSIISVVKPNYLWRPSISVPKSLKRFRLLRVLDVGAAPVRYLPAGLFELFHLRYLALNYGGIIPGAISNLQKLQTLIKKTRGKDRWETNMLPQEIWSLRQLRHLVFCGDLPCPIETTLILENLQTLSSLSYYLCTEGTLKMIPNLKKFGICCYGHPDGTYLNNLVDLHHLVNLELRLCSLRNEGWPKDSLMFPRMLRKLTLRGLKLPWDEMTVIGSLPNLQVLKLTDFACQGSTWETTEGEFPKLEFLLIEISELKYWVTESSHFPRLKSLLLYHCWHLTEIPTGIGEIPTLKLIEVKGHAERSLLHSAKWILEEQRSWGNDALRVCCMAIPVPTPEESKHWPSFARGLEMYEISDDDRIPKTPRLYRFMA